MPNFFPQERMRQKLSSCFWRDITFFAEKAYPKYPKRRRCTPTIQGISHNQPAAWGANANQNVTASEVGWLLLCIGGFLQQLPLEKPKNSQNSSAIRVFWVNYKSVNVIVKLYTSRVRIVPRRNTPSSLFRLKS